MELAGPTAGEVPVKWHLGEVPVKWHLELRSTTTLRGGGGYVLACFSPLKPHALCSRAAALTVSGGACVVAVTGSSFCVASAVIDTFLCCHSDAPARGAAR
jgi:hypothetical protein